MTINYIYIYETNPRILSPDVLTTLVRLFDSPPHNPMAESESSTIMRLDSSAKRQLSATDEVLFWQGNVPKILPDRISFVSGSQDAICAWRPKSSNWLSEICDGEKEIYNRLGDSQWEFQSLETGEVFRSDIGAAKLMPMSTAVIYQMNRIATQTETSIRRHRHRRPAYR